MSSRIGLLICSRNDEIIINSFFSFFHDISYSPIYEITYFCFSYATCTTISGAVGVDTLFAGYIFNIVCHLNILQKRFHHRHDTAMQPLFEYHSHILELCSFLNEIYSEIVFTQFLISSLLLCAIGFQITLVCL